MADLDKIFGSVITVDDASSFSQQILDLIQVLQGTDDDFQQKLEIVLDEEYYDNFRSYLKSNGIGIDDRQSLQKLMQEMHTLVMDLPTMTLTLSFRPRQIFIEKIRQWLVDYGPGSFKLETDVDTTLVAGTVISWNGNVSRYALNESLSDGYITDKL